MVLTEVKSWSAQYNAEKKYWTSIACGDSARGGAVTVINRETCNSIKACSRIGSTWTEDIIKITQRGIRQVTPNKLPCVGVYCNPDPN